MRPSHLQVDSQRGFIRIVLHIFARADSVCRPRPESGQSQPTLDAIRNLAKALSVSADMLLFEKDERGPDEDLKLQFEAVSRLDPEEKKIIRSMIESILLRHEARRWSAEKSG